MSLVPTIASLLVHVDLDPRNRGRIELASALADRFGARLVGAAAGDFQFPIYGDLSAAVDARMLDDTQRQIEADLAKAEELFRVGAGVRERLEWRSAKAPPERFLAAQARCADLVVIGQGSRGASDEPLLDADPGAILMEAGRPVLVVPPMVRALEGRRVLVAWKEAREARRALREGLPFMVDAEAVLIACIGEQADPDEVQDVRSYLRAHGIEARPVYETKPRASVGDTLLQIADAEGVDLLVAGAYGHSRLREWVLGGVTNDLLRHAPVCCLMAH